MASNRFRGHVLRLFLRAYFFWFQFVPILRMFTLPVPRIGDIPTCTRAFASLIDPCLLPEGVFTPPVACIIDVRTLHVEAVVL